jgi:hypothetical protein
MVRLIQKVFYPLKQTIVEDNVNNAFQMPGFEFDMKERP